MDVWLMFLIMMIVGLACDYRYEIRKWMIRKFIQQLKMRGD